MEDNQIFDVSGIPLTPSSQGEKCLGNGNYSEYECCCDECDYFCTCFPQFRTPIKSKEV